MDNYGYTAIVGVRKSKATPNSQNRFCVCRVPDGWTVDNGAMILYGYDGNNENEKGICISDTMFVDDKTLDMICTVTSAFGPLPSVKAMINLRWLDPKEADKEKEVCQ